jgi:hypothetical protein
VKRMSTAAAVAIVAAAMLLLSGCAFGPDPRAASERAAAVFDDLTAELSAADPAVVRTVEIVPTDPIACEDEEQTQQVLLARGTLSVRATDGAAGEVVNSLAAEIDGDEWEPVPTDLAGTRSWSNDDGANVTITDADPVVVVTVFGPCLAPVADAAGSPGQNP